MRPIRRIKNAAKLAKKVAHYQAVKDTPGYQLTLQAEKHKANTAITKLGYSPERAEQAVNDYAAATQNTQLGPDWPGFIDLVSRAGLVD